MDILKPVAHAGLAYNADEQFDEPYCLTTKENGLRVEYETTVRRIETEIDVSQCNSTTKRRIKHAVWDTGATSSVIREDVARSMSLPPVDTGYLVTATGKTEVPICMLDVHLSDTQIVRNMKVFVSPMENRVVDFLIGMDIISKGRLTVDNVNGKTAVSFALK